MAPWDTAIFGGLQSIFLVDLELPKRYVSELPLIDGLGKRLGSPPKNSVIPGTLMGA